MSSSPVIHEQLSFERLLTPVAVLFVFSGMASLMYEVLWLKDLSRLFGSTSLGMSVTLAVFFLGLAIGSYIAGRFARRIRNPLLAYAMLEIGIALTAIWYILLLGLSYRMMPDIVEHTGLASNWLTVFKSLLAVVILLPPAVLMGATFPLIAQSVIRSKRAGNYGVGLLYATNLMGATVGAFLAGFVLPPWLGYSRSYVVIICINLILAAAAGLLSRRYSAQAVDDRRTHQLLRHLPGPDITEPALGTRLLGSVVFISGFATIALEVGWTRMLSQVSNSDVYSFSAILIVFLASLSLGALLAHLLRVAAYPAPYVVSGLSAVGGLLAVASIFLFHFITRGMVAMPGGGSWFAVVLGTFLVVTVTVAGPVIVLGALFPYVLKVATKRRSVGRRVGLLVAINTCGTVIGSLLAGFVMLPWLGMFRTVVLLGVAYLLLAAVVLISVTRDRMRRWLVLSTLSVVSVGVLSVAGVLPEVQLKKQFHETLLSLDHGSGGSVAVVRGYGPQDDPKGQGDMYIKLNNTYTLGGLGAYADQQRQAHLGFWLNPQASTAFFLGLATGTTAGASLYYPVDKTTVCELVPEVISAARQYFVPYTNGLFSDRRATVIAEDGRSCLAYGSGSYDVIVSDLFNPTHAGTGNVYTREHYESVQQRLGDDGVFVQWLPLYQLTEQDFGTIARTMTDVFSQVTLWRGNFSADKPIVALVGQRQGATLNPATIEQGIATLAASKDTNAAPDALLSVKPGSRHALLDEDQKAYVQSIWPQLSRSAPYTFYVGNITQQREKFARYAANTDDRPVIEFNAPKHAASGGAVGNLLVGSNLIAFTNNTFAKGIPQDPYLRALSPDQVLYVTAGYDYYDYFAKLQMAYYAKDTSLAQEAQRSFQKYLEKTSLTEYIPNSGNDR